MNVLLLNYIYILYYVVICAACCCCGPSDKEIVQPVVSVYPAASRDHLEEKNYLLCVASAMFPPVVQFSWRRQKKNGALQVMLPDEGEQLEMTESGYTTAILVVDRHDLDTFEYRCYVEHEGGTVEAPEQQGQQALMDSFSSD